jgi:hypothetical protein
MKKCHDFSHVNYDTRYENRKGQMGSTPPLIGPTELKRSTGFSDWARSTMNWLLERKRDGIFLN